MHFGTTGQRRRLISSLQRFQAGISEMRRQLINKEDYMRSDQVNQGYKGSVGYI